MLTTKPSKFGVFINYDDHEFGVVPLDSDAILVTCKRRGEWANYGIYRNFAEACEAIFYGTILVERTECGHIEFDMFGNIRKLIPLTYYES